MAGVVGLSLCVVASLRAQSSGIVPRLPASTMSYVEWRGSDALAASSKDNHVMQLMADPAMMPLWLGMAADFQKQQRASKAPAPPLTMPEVISLLQNPAVFGLMEMPRAADASPAGKPGPRIAAFLVYDATGKAALIEKWESATETRGPNPPKVTHYQFSGTSVEVRSSKTGASYSAQVGSYFLTSDRKRTIEQLIARFSSAAAPADSITQRPEYAEVRKFVGSGGVFEFFARMPNVRDVTPVDGKSQTGTKIIKSIHLEKVRAAGGSLSFAGPAMRMRGAIFGDTQPPGPFDIAGASREMFRTQAIAGGSPEFSVSRVNLAAIYRLFYGAIVPNLPPQQAASLSAVEGMAQGFLGMSIPDALDLFTGEMAASTSFSNNGTQEQIFAATIQKPESVLRILRAVLGPMTLAEDTYGDATMLDMAVPYHDPATGLQRRKMYYVAVTPQLLLVAPRKTMLRAVLEQTTTPIAGAAPAAAKSVFADPQYAQLRAQLPEKLSGLGVLDVSQVPWSPVLANIESRTEQSAKVATQEAERLSKNKQSVPPPDLSWIKLVDPNLIPRHLHMFVSGWWKDTDGVYFDSYVQ